MEHVRREKGGRCVKNAPKSVTIRSYQVGFGDCFLLQFHYASSVRNVLIDFGTTGIPDSLQTTPSVHMPRVAEKIAEHCGKDVAKGTKGKLHAIVATHRHKDHISGFATDGSNGGSGKTIKDLNPDVIVQPWTEDPSAAEEATHARETVRETAKRVVKVQTDLLAMHAVAAAAVKYAKRELQKKGSTAMSVRTLKKLQFIGEDNVSNLSAVKNLIDMGGRPGATAIYANYGSVSGLEAVLPGVKITVLGPPTLEQTDRISTMRSRDGIEFWHLLSGPLQSPQLLPLAHGMLREKAMGRVKLGINLLTLPSQVRWFARRLASLRSAQILEIVTSLDEQMNNTSLILLFEFGGRKLLFPGDAQLENWRYALQEVGKESKKNVALVSDIDLYKVGHHGSLNATPKKMLWEKLTRRNAPGGARLRTILSTMPGKHMGKVGGGGEVPRKPLLKALKDETVLFSTDNLRKSAKPEDTQLFQEVILDA